MHAANIEIFKVTIRGGVVCPDTHYQIEKKWVSSLYRCFDLFPYSHSFRYLATIF